MSIFVEGEVFGVSDCAKVNVAKLDPMTISTQFQHQRSWFKRDTEYTEEYTLKHPFNWPDFRGQHVIVENGKTIRVHTENQWIEISSDADGHMQLWTGNFQYLIDCCDNTIEGELRLCDAR